MIVPASSFRDPDASLSFGGGRILRAVKSEASQAFAAMLEHPFIRRLMADGRLVGTARLPEGSSAHARDGVVYEHDESRSSPIHSSGRR